MTKKATKREPKVLYSYTTFSYKLGTTGTGKNRRTKVERGQSKTIVYKPEIQILGVSDGWIGTGGDKLRLSKLLKKRGIQ